MKEHEYFLNDIRNIIKKEMEEKEITQEMLAKLMEVTQSRISQILHSDNVSTIVLNNILKALNIDIEIKKIIKENNNETRRENETI